MKDFSFNIEFKIIFNLMVGQLIDVYQSRLLILYYIKRLSRLKLKIVFNRFKTGKLETLLKQRFQ